MLPVILFNPILPDACKEKTLPYTGSKNLPNSHLLGHDLYQIIMKRIIISIQIILKHNTGNVFFISHAHHCIGGKYEQQNMKKMNKNDGSRYL